MTTYHLFTDTRLMMLRARRRVFLRSVVVRGGLLAFAGSCAFLAGYCMGG